MTLSRRWFGTAVLAAALSIPAVAVATPLLTITNNTGVELGNPPFTLGWEFRVANAVVITDLGFFDDSQNGLVESHQVGLWNSAGTLLASATVPSGSAGTLINQFRYTPIAPLLLASGESYRVGALFLSGLDFVSFFGATTGLATDPAIAYTGSRFAGGNALQDPTANAGSDGYFGPNLNGTLADGAVPEPTSIALLGSGLAMLARKRRKNRQNRQL